MYYLMGSDFDFTSLDNLPFEQVAKGVKRFEFVAEANILDDPRNGNAYQVNDNRFAVINPYACRVVTYFFNNAIYETVVIEESKCGEMYYLGEGTDDTFIRVKEIVYVYDLTFLPDITPTFGNSELVKFVLDYSNRYWING